MYFLNLITLNIHAVIQLESLKIQNQISLQDNPLTAATVTTISGPVIHYRIIDFSSANPKLEVNINVDFE